MKVLISSRVKSFCSVHAKKSGPKFIKLFSCSVQQSLKFILLINVKMPTIVGILPGAF